jgi:hypothetical protein
MCDVILNPLQPLRFLDQPQFERLSAPLPNIAAFTAWIVKSFFSGRRALTSDQALGALLKPGKPMVAMFRKIGKKSHVVSPHVRE